MNLIWTGSKPEHLMQQHDKSLLYHAKKILLLGAISLLGPKELF
jgi:hypothetical protein